MAARVHLGKAAHIAHAHHLHGEVAQDVDEARGPRPQPEEEKEGRGDGAEQLFEQMHEAVLEELDEFVADCERVGVAFPQVGHVVHLGQYLSHD